VFQLLFEAAAATACLSLSRLSYNMVDIRSRFSVPLFTIYNQLYQLYNSVSPFRWLHSRGGEGIFSLPVHRSVLYSSWCSAVRDHNVSLQTGSVANPYFVFNCSPRRCCYSTFRRYV